MKCQDGKTATVSMESNKVLEKRREDRKRIVYNTIKKSKDKEKTVERLLTLVEMF